MPSRKIFVGTGMVDKGMKMYSRSSCILAPSYEAAVTYWQGAGFFPNEIREVEADEDTGFPVIPVIQFDTELKG